MRVRLYALMAILLMLVPLSVLFSSPAGADSNTGHWYYTNTYGTCAFQGSHFPNLYGYAYGETKGYGYAPCSFWYVNLYYPYLQLATGSGNLSYSPYAAEAVSPYQADPPYSEHKGCDISNVCSGYIGLS